MSDRYPWLPDENDPGYKKLIDGTITKEMVCRPAVIRCLHSSEYEAGSPNCRSCLVAYLKENFLKEFDAVEVARRDRDATTDYSNWLHATKKLFDAKLQLHTAAVTKHGYAQLHGVVDVAEEESVSPPHYVMQAAGEGIIDFINTKSCYFAYTLHRSYVSLIDTKDYGSDK